MSVENKQTHKQKKKCNQNEEQTDQTLDFESF